MLGPLPSFYSGENKHGVGCLPALITLTIILALIIGFFAYVYWAYRFGVKSL